MVLAILDGSEIDPRYVSNANDDLLVVSEAATMLGVSEHSIYNWVASGQLLAAKTIGGRYRFRRGDIRKLLDAVD